MDGHTYTKSLDVSNEQDALAELALFDRDPAAHQTKTAEKSGWLFGPDNCNLATVALPCRAVTPPSGPQESSARLDVRAYVGFISRLTQRIEAKAKPSPRRQSFELGADLNWY